MKNFSIRPRDDGRAAKRAIVRPDSGLSDWLQNEVAIDFPSLDRAVERMRDAFLAPLDDSELQPELSAELRLTPREAFQGVTLPLDVPVRKICARCGGRGESWSDPCETCDGSGHSIARHPVRLVVPSRVQDGDRFSLSVCAPASAPTRIAVRIAIR
jgi:hypothetical protein